MNLATRCVFIALLLSVGGCSSIPVDAARAMPVPNNRVFAPELLRPATASEGVATFSRDWTFFGAGCGYTINVNGKPAFDLRGGEMISLSLEPGEYLFRLDSTTPVCPSVTLSESARVAPGARMHFRVLLPSDMTVRFTRID